jgi:HEPN domain-containing protein
MQGDPGLVREWVAKAQSDLRTAERLLETQPTFRDTGCFHCQQAVEKLLKGFLLHHGVATPKVHVLGMLFDLCEPVDSVIAALRNDCEPLSRFAVEVRYPGAPLPSAARAAAALTAMRTAWKVVLDRLPPEVRP